MMISQKLKTLFYISVPVFIAHGLEEYFTGFYHIDPSIQAAFGRFDFSLANTFLVFQVIFWSLLILGLILIKRNILTKTVLFILGLVFFFELHHIYKAIMASGYYPGLYTALVFPVIGFLFWKELLKNFKTRHGI